MLAFNGNLSEPRFAHLRSHLSRLIRRPVISECFGRATIESAYLSGIADTYDKRQLNADWTLGPNNLFFHFRDLAFARGYQYMAQIEPDVVPLRPRWLEKLACLAVHSSAWVIGSPFLSRCARDARSRSCEGLGDGIKFHLNGNALHAVGDAGFRRYSAHAAASSVSRWPFDLAVHKHSAVLHGFARRRLAPKFRAHPFIVNFGAEPIAHTGLVAAPVLVVATSGRPGRTASAPVHGDAAWEANASRTAARSTTIHSGAALAAADTISLITPRESAAVAVSGAPTGAATPIAPMVPPAARGVEANVFHDALPYTYLVHSSWLTRRARNQPAIGVRGWPMLRAHEWDNTRQASHSDSPPSLSDLSTGISGIGCEGVACNLLSMAHGVSDSHGQLILTFATAVYDPLCKNFVAHLRRLHLKNYLLITFNASYHRTLTGRGEEPYLHVLKALSSEGSDVFASKDFFMINAARYTVLVRLLRGGLNVFAMDLDVVLLHNPFPHVRNEPCELLLQSDARDAITLVETSPFLLRDRLHLTNASNVTYVNGGVFFARGSHAVARLFEDTWALTSQKLGELNEQDCLNRMLLASTLVWAPLPPRLFPNGFVYFRRPIGAALSDPGPVLVHCNWITSIAAKRYLLREAQLWAAADDDLAGAATVPMPRFSARGPSPRDGGIVVADAASVARGRPFSTASARYLAYDVGAAASQRTLGAQVRAFLVALTLAHITNRTLVLPVFYVVPGGRLPAKPMPPSSPGRHLGYPRHEAAKRGTHEELQHPTVMGRRPLTYLLEYTTLVRHFPRVVHSSLLRTRSIQVLPPTSVETVPLATSTQSSTAATLPMGRELAARELRAWLEHRNAVAFLHVTGLCCAGNFPRAAGALEPAFSALLGRHEQRFGRRLAAAVQPAPELRAIASHITAMIRAYIHRELAGRQPIGNWVHSARMGTMGDFHCLHVTRDELASASRLRAAASGAPHHIPTLVVTELDAGGAVSPRHGGESEDNMTDLQGTRRSARGRPSRYNNPASASSPRQRSLPIAAHDVFQVPLHTSDFYPYWDEVEVTDVRDERTLAYDMVQQLVCAAAQKVFGNPARDFVQAVCLWRRSTSGKHAKERRRAGSLSEVEAEDAVCHETAGNDLTFAHNA